MLAPSPRNGKALDKSLLIEPPQSKDRTAPSAQEYLTGNSARSAPGAG